MNSTPSGTALAELSQAKARLGVSLFALVYVASWTLVSSPVSPTIIWTLLAYAAFSIGWLLLVKAWPGEFPWRRWVVIVSDLGINTFFMHTLQAKGAFFYPMYLWIIVGNGVRFGPRYLIVSMAVAIGYFAPMLFLSTYWQANRVAGSGLLAGFVVLPVFYLSIIKNLHNTNARLVEEIERSQAATRSKTEFLANMSHELRTPMSGVIGIAELLRETSLTAAQQNYVDIIQGSADALLQIIDDVLDLSKIEARKITLNQEPVDLGNLATEVLNLLRPSAEGKGIDLRLEIPDSAPGHLIGDATRIRQVLFNLVGNAIKFTEQGHVAVRYQNKPLTDQKTAITFQIEDTGVGIAPEKLEHIFDKFEQAEARLSRRFGGSGLGLAISRQLVRLMEGDISVESELGEGTTFSVELTLTIASTPTLVSHDARVSASSMDHLRVLVVEDNPVNLLVIEGYLKRLGAVARVAKDGETALKMARREDFNLVFMDVQLPVLDGLEVTRRIRAEEADGHRIAIVALTANAFDEDRAACLDAGMDLHLHKPVRMNDLEQAIATLEHRNLIPRRDTSDTQATPTRRNRRNKVQYN